MGERGQGAGGWAGVGVAVAGGAAGAGLGPDEGPPVSVIRLIEVKPDVESEAITRATVS